jgi:hypothetical protein
VVTGYLLLVDRVWQRFQGIFPRTRHHPTGEAGEAGGTSLPTNNQQHITKNIYNP